MSGGDKVGICIHPARDVLMQMLRAANARIARLESGLLVDITNPERLRDLATELAAYSAVHVLKVPVGSESAWVRTASPSGIASRADRIEAEQVEKAERDGLVEEMAKSMFGADPLSSWSWDEMDEKIHSDFRIQARALLSRFDVTPKVVSV